VTGPAFEQRHYTSQDGLTLAYRCYGSSAAHGAAVLCLPGLTRNAKDFDKLARHLAPRHRVLCPDYRGRGDSDADPDWRNYVPGTYLNDLKHLLVIEGVHRCIAVGTSMGGFLAMGLALSVPGLLAGVVLNDTAPDLHMEGIGRIMAYVSQDHPQDDRAAAAAFLRDRFGERWTRATDADWLDFADATFKPSDDGKLHVSWDIALARPILEGKAPTPDLWRLFDSLAGRPLLALRGALSDVVLPEAMDRMAARHKGMHQATVAGIGHTPTLAEPEALAAIDAFLAEAA
jgi:pimeloyl-ACP methyl ester carboxylesterase